MGSSFFEICVRRPVMTTMMSLALMVFGGISLTRLPVRELPDADPIIVNILTLYPGASAEVVESEITQRLEEAISSASGIKQILSESREEGSVINVEFIQGTDEDVAAQEVRDRVARVRGELPDDVEEPVVAKQDASARPIIWIAFFSDRFNTQQLSQIAEEQVKDRLQTVPGVSQVILGGEKRWAMRLWLDSARMAARGVAVLDVERALRTQSVELPSGRVENLDRELTIQTRGQLQTAEEFNRLIIRQDGNSVVRLEDIGYAEEGVEDERVVARFKGQPSIGLGIVRQSRANTLDVARGVKSRMDEIAPLLPDGIQYEFPYDESIYVEKAVHEVVETLFIAFGLVVLTIFIFLRDLRSTIIPAVTVPVSVLATFGLLYLLGYSVNIFTLLALVLAIGIVVDDAIVVLENIFRHIEAGDTPMEASLKTMREIAFAIVTITLSLVAVFLPLAFVGGLTGKLLIEFAVALAGSVVFSAFVALTLSPMISARILRSKSEEKHGRVFAWFERRFDKLAARYERVLGWSLNHRAAVVVLAGGLMALTVYFFQNLEQEFLPEEDKGRFLAIAITPQGSTPDYTDRMMRQMEEIAGQTSELTGYFSAVALPFNGPGDPTQGFMFMRLAEGERRALRDVVGGPTGLGARFITEVEGAIAIPILPKAVDLGISQPYELVLTHTDIDEMYAFSQQLMNRLRQEGFLANVRASMELTKPELDLRVDRDRAGVLNVSVADISRTLQILFGGQDLADIKQRGRQFEVVVQLKRDRRLTPSDLDRIYVPDRNGKLVQLSNLVSVETGAGPNRIERYNRQRSTTIQGTPVGVPLGTAMARTEEILKEMLPPGHGYTWKGESQNLRDSSGEIWFFLGMAIVVVYMVLAAQFESFVHPFTVMLALPLAFLGAFGLLYGLSWVNHFGTNFFGWANYAPDPPEIAHTLSKIVPRIPSMNLNIFSQVGLVLLVGLVTKNSILLVEFANQERARGLDAKAAMLNAGKIRLRPILMTSFATIAGILPIAIGLGASGEARRPLGVVAVGGMVTSTILTLVVIPVIYTLFSRMTKEPEGTVEALPK
ncbi:MAG: efflux RND transporter permease subunit [Verrucomicrobiales bacterium]|nr:efflux RND transporter permease subunit [Verrucomicrobiales bacterium]